MTVTNWTGLWLAIGALLCVMELFVPTAFVEMAMGISALLVAFCTPLIPSLNVQIALWMVLSVMAVYAVKRWMPQQRSLPIDEETEAEALTAMEPGETGRVLFEGNSWRAKCEGDRPIRVHDRAIVVGRKGNTLLIMLDEFQG
ncbi:MAG: NfeD family protein [Oscillatoriales cyanobacterium]|nr:MAG: NfeD family protein [Oscillatoriales cyanobacterium]